MVHLDSWKKFESVYEAQYKKYVSAAYEDGSANKNEVDAKTSGEIVDALTAAWKDLRFTSATTGNDLLDSNNNAEHQSGRTQVIYRLSRGSSKHLYTADPKEQPALLASGWSKDGGEPSFFVPAQYTTSTKVSRLYSASRRAHLYSTDQNEIKVLSGREPYRPDAVDRPAWQCRTRCLVMITWSSSSL